MRLAKTDYLVGTPRSMLNKLEQSLTQLSHFAAKTSASP